LRIGIIGAGALAQAFAVRAIASGHSVTLSNSRGPDTLAGVIDSLGPHARAGTKFQAADADTVVLAVPEQRVGVALSELGDWDGRTLVDATNHFSLPSPPYPGVMSSSEIVAGLARGANLVKALNTLFAAALVRDPEPVPGLHRVLFVSGDDLPSKEAFLALLSQMRFAPVDLGSLAEGSRMQQAPGGALTGIELFRRLPIARTPQPAVNP
jgi:predicted dinucleotide-binding enzyme